MAAKKGISKINLTPRWKSFLIASSVTLNIAFVVVFIVIVGTNALDGMVMKEGLTRYCETKNDAKFKDSPDGVKALREFTCAKGEAADDFETAIDAYLTSKGIK